MQQAQQTIVIERDIDQDRFISYERYKQLISQWPTLSKNQVFFMMLGVTGWRPCELVVSKVEDIDIEQKRIKWRVAKPKQVIKDNYLVKQQKIKWRILPDWAFKILDAYIKNNYLNMINGYLFPSRQNMHGNHVTVAGMQEELKKMRDKLYDLDREKWGWVKEPYQKIIYPNGRAQFYYKISLYAFRKMHATYYAQMLLDKGITDVLLHTAVHMAHTKPETTYRYVKSLMDEKKMSEGFKKAVDYSFDFAYSRPKIDKFQKKLQDYAIEYPIKTIDKPIRSQIKKDHKPFVHYTRQCRRCDKIYKTEHKHSEFCDNCKLEPGGDNGYKGKPHYSRLFKK